MSLNSCVAIEIIPSLTCQVCLDTWTNPIKLVPCGHIFCAQCGPPGIEACPLCKCHVEWRDLPEEDIIQTSDLVRVKCGGCGWKGSRKASTAHRCGVRDTHSELESFPHQSDEELLQELRGLEHEKKGLKGEANRRRVASPSQDRFPPEVRQGIPLARNRM